MPKKIKEFAEQNNEEDSEDSIDEEEENEEITEKKPCNNQELMKVRLEEIKSKLDWTQHLDIVMDVKELTIPSVTEGDDEKKEKQKASKVTQMEDDFKREMAFYCQAQVAAREALSKLRAAGIPTQRPEDYFAEMVKSDIHMQKVRKKLLSKKELMERSEKAKKQRQLKKFGKKIQQDVLQKRQQEKKSMLQAVDRIKKNKNKMGKLSGNDDLQDMFDVNTDSKKREKPGQKRKRKDEKFGFGGKKKRIKKNSAESSADFMSSFKRSVHGNKNEGKPGAGKFRGKGAAAAKGKSKRLGKSRRLNNRKK